MSRWLHISQGLLHYKSNEVEIRLTLIRNNGLTSECIQSVVELSSINKGFNPRYSFTNTYIRNILNLGMKPDNLSIVGSTVHLTTTLPNLKSSAVFTWEFQMTECYNVPESVYNPLIATSMLLLDQRTAMAALLRKKDKEIEEYKSLGLTLSKKSKLSEPFDQEKVLGAVKHTTRTLSDMLGSEGFMEAYDTVSATSGGVVKVERVKKEQVTLGIVFEDSFSQPDPSTPEPIVLKPDPVSPVKKEEERRSKKTRRLNHPEQKIFKMLVRLNTRYIPNPNPLHPSTLFCGSQRLLHSRRVLDTCER
eukprot:sb/3479684/